MRSPIAIKRAQNSSKPIVTKIEKEKKHPITKSFANYWQNNKHPAANSLQSRATNHNT